MEDYKLIDVRKLEFTKLLKNGKYLPSDIEEIDSYCHIIIESVIKVLASLYPDRTIEYVYKVYKYTDCDPSQGYGYRVGGAKTQIKRGSLEQIENEMNEELLRLYFYSIGGFSWEPIREDDEEENQ
jgi:hypothetical protein